jgi:hypothetical protein
MDWEDVAIAGCEQATVGGTARDRETLEHTIGDDTRPGEACPSAGESGPIPSRRGPGQGRPSRAGTPQGQPMTRDRHKQTQKALICWQPR